ncbi:hypothetical protein OROMI_006852 [Orobanche minor]
MTTKKGLLKTEYGYVMAMTNKIVMGMSGGFDQLSSVKFPIFGAMLQETRVNWPEYIYRQLVREVNKADWDSIEGRFGQKLAYGTQLSWILEFLGKAKGRAETFIASKRLGHIQGNSTEAAQFLSETKSGTPSFHYEPPSDSEETQSDAARPKPRATEDRSERQYEAEDSDNDNVPLSRYLKRKLTDEAQPTLNQPEMTEEAQPSFSQPEQHEEAQPTYTQEETILIHSSPEKSPNRRKLDEELEIRMIISPAIFTPPPVRIEEVQDEEDQEMTVEVLPLLSNLPSFLKKKKKQTS